MFILYGRRSSKLKDQFKLEHCTCPNCGVNGTFTVSTFGSFAHIFFLPFFPLFKSRTIECDNCLRTFTEKEITPEMQDKLQRGIQVYPGKRPLWHGCGCLIIFAFIAMGIIGSFLGDSNPDEDYDYEEDPMEETYQDELNIDIDRTLSHPTKSRDALAYHLAHCFDYELTEELDRDQMEFLTRENGNKLLVLVKMKEIKRIERKERKQLLGLIKNCLAEEIDLNDYELYIGVHGKITMMVASSPTERDDYGLIADDDILLPFYEDEADESDINMLLDTTVIE